MLNSENRNHAVPLHVTEAGAGSETFIFIHGWMTSARVWEPLLGQLPGFRCLAPDLRGAGASPGAASVTLADYVDDLSLLCSSRDLTGVHLVGHSMGGQLAAMLAARHPERFATLSLLNPVPVSGLPMPEQVLPLFRHCGGQRDQLAQILDMACLALSPAQRELLLEEAVRIDPIVISTGFEAWRRGAETALETLTLPVTVVATDDPFLPQDFLRQAVLARFPQGRLVHLPGPGHYPQLEATEAVAALLREVAA